MQRVAVAGGDLFRLSASLLNDPLQWYVLAQENALTDILVQGLTLLSLRDAPTKP